MSSVIVVTVVAIITMAIILNGGAPTPLGHLYYVPILYVAARHGRLGAFLVATLSGLAMGPLMPVTNDTAGIDEWGTRLAIYILVGQVAAWLTLQDPRPLDLIVRDVIMSRDLRSSVRHGRIKVHYQPLVSLREGEVIGVEALCRWNDKRGQTVPPSVFIPAAEHTGAILALGREVLRIATKQSNEWAASQGNGMAINVNVSALQLGDPGFVSELSDVVGSASERPYRLCIEITETAIIADPEAALATLNELRKMGALIALDDFGTGQSSLAYLAALPIDIIKIDQAFVASVDTDSTHRALVSAVIHLASSLGALTIAEGIETPGQLHVLRELGCDIGQGYYFGRPSDAADVDWTARKVA